MSFVDPISRPDSKGALALNAYRDAQRAGLSLVQLAVLNVRLGHLGLESPGVTWTAPDEMHECSRIRDIKTIRAADRALVAMGILSVAEEAGFYRSTRYRVHLDRLAAIAAERRKAFEAARVSPGRPGRKAKLTGATPLPFAEIDGGVAPNWQGRSPPELRTTSEDIQSSVCPSDSAPPAAAPTASEAQGQDALPSKSKRREAKQWSCHRTGWKVPREVSPPTWAMAVERMSPSGKPIAQKALRSWTSDAYAAIRAGRDADLVLANAARCGMPRPDADRLPGWAETLGDQPPDLIAGTLLFRFAAFDCHADAMRAAVRGMLAEGFAVDQIAPIADAVEKHIEAAAAPTIADPVAALVHNVPRHFQPDPDLAEAFQTSEEVGFQTQQRFYPGVQEFVA